MNKKNTPILSIALYVLSGLNLLVMIICLVTAVNADGTIRSNAFFAQAIFGTLADVFLGYLSQAIRGIAFLFTLINAGISVMLFTAARLVKSSHSLSIRVQQLETRLDISSIK
ncbi:MAG: hypothetical protein HGB14_00240 [Anaerolineaceae bacterium]|nr:hypothetical protein [Anaerolineaceae bacterium]